MSIEEYLLGNPHKKMLYNPLAAEFGIEDMAQMNDFVRNEMPKFKMVRGILLLRFLSSFSPLFFILP